MKDLAKDSTKDIPKDVAQLYHQLHAPIAEGCLREGVSLVALEIRGSRERRIVEIFVDKPDGISLDECGDLSHSIGEMLEEIKAFPAAYRLEVSSPGVERPLQYIWQYARNTGRLLAVELADGTSLKGRITAVEGETITLESPGKSGTKNGKLARRPTTTKISKTAPGQGAQGQDVVVANVDVLPIFPITLPHSAIKRAVIELEF